MSVEVSVTQESIEINIEESPILIETNGLMFAMEAAASYPDFTSNAAKVLTVNATEDGVEWTTVSSGGVALGETSSTAYRGDNGKIAYDHSQSQGNPHNTTTSEINEGTKLFFTEDRARQTVLTGLNTSTATPALATDQLLAAIGKLQAQINNIAPPTWVNASSIGLMHPNIPPTNNFIELARINGMLWIRGSFKNIGAILYETQPFFLRIDNIQYKVLHRNTTGSTRLATIAPRNAENIAPTIAFMASGVCLDASATSNQYFSIMATSILASNSFYHLPPTCLGELVIK